MDSKQALAKGSAPRVIKAAAASALREMLLDGRLDEPMRIQVKPNFDTACWAWQGGVHRVFLGDGVLDRARAGLSEMEMASYAGRYVHHERAHALFTERDAERLMGWLAECKVPFGLLNLVEDARVEEKYRATSTDEFRFQWTAYEAQSGEAHAVGSAGEAFAWAFYRIIQSEGSEIAWEGGQSAFAGAIADAAVMYGLAVRAVDTKGAVVVAAKILAKYPELSGMTGRCGMEVGASLSGEGGKRVMEAFEEDAEDHQSDGRAGEGEKKADDDMGHQFQGTDLLGSSEVVLDQARVSRLAERLSRLHGVSREVRKYEVRPQKRVSVRHAMQGSARWLGVKRASGVQKVNNVLMVVDVSGSMEGSALVSAAHLIGALSECASSGCLRGTVVLSTTSDEGSKWMRKDLPWSRDDVKRLVTHDAEGLDGTLRVHDREMVEADETYVFTDGNIGGPKIRHAEYQRRGMRVTGLYCNEEREELESVEGQMGKHFRRFVVRGNVEGIVEAIVMG